MSTEKNIQTVKNFFAAIGRGERKGLLALVAEDIEWIIPGKDWPLAGTRHGHAGLADLLLMDSITHRPDRPFVNRDAAVSYEAQAICPQTSML